MTADWALFWITLVYVIATCAICFFNYRSAKATREQVEISKIQFEEARRIELMPLLQIAVLRDRPIMEIPNLSLLLSSEDTSGVYKIVELELYVENIGLGTAKDIEYTWVNLSGANKRQDFPVIALCPQNFYQCYIDINASDDLLSNIAEAHAEIILSYKDLLDNSYTQKINLTFSTGAEKEGFVLKDYCVSAAEYIKEKLNYA